MNEINAFAKPFANWLDEQTAMARDAYQTAKLVKDETQAEWWAERLDTLNEVTIKFVEFYAQAPATAPGVTDSEEE